jgi:hypothetical protein
MEECRAAVGPCDIAETCSGTTADCPADKLKSNTAVCRPAADVCDSAEFCSGTDVGCPTDSFKPNSAECRPSAGACDVAEFCTGGSPSCPTNDFKPASTECRAATGVCDVAESCSGTSAACPNDEFQPSGQACAAGSCQAGACRAEADLSLTVFPGATTVHGQDPLSVQIPVSNAGKSAATAVKVRVDLPKDATAQGGNGDGWSCQPDDTGTTCQRQSLDVGAVPMLTLTVTPPQVEKMFTISAQVSATEFDPNQDNNTASVQITNDAPAGQGGCSMSPHGLPSGRGPELSLLFLLSAFLFTRRRRGLRA